MYDLSIPTDHTDTARTTILHLLELGLIQANAADAAPNLYPAAAFARGAHAYLSAAQNLLSIGFAHLHNELIEHPDFVTLRRFARRFPI